MELYLVNESAIIRATKLYNVDDEENLTIGRKLDLTVNKVVPQPVDQQSELNRKFVEKFNKVIASESNVKEGDGKKDFDISTIWKPCVDVFTSDNNGFTGFGGNVPVIPSSSLSPRGNVKVYGDPYITTGFDFLRTLDTILNVENLTLIMNIPFNRDSRDNFSLSITNLNRSSPGVWTDCQVNLPGNFWRIGLNAYGDCLTGNLTVLLRFNDKAVEQVEDLFANISCCGQLLQGVSLDTSVMNRKLLQDGTCSDFVIQCKNGSRVPCHKAFLAVNSPVFQAMFQSGMKESENNSLDLGEISEVGVNALLSFVYCFEVTSALQNCNVAVELLELAHKYDIPQLSRRIQSILILKPKTWYTLDAALRLLQFSKKVGDELEEVIQKMEAIVELLEKESANGLIDS